MQSRSFTRYSVESSRQEMRAERVVRVVEWVLIAVASVVIVVFAYLLVAGSLQ